MCSFSVLICKACWEKKQRYYFSKVIIGENCHINPWHCSFKQGRNLVPFSCSKRNSQPDKIRLPFLKYIVKNMAFVVSSFRGLCCSCTLPVLLPSFVRRPFANSGEGLHFFSPTVLSVSAVDEGLDGPSPSCVNSIPEASSLALVPERGTGSFILVSWNCLSALGHQNRECSFHKIVRVPASQYINSDLTPCSSELCIREVFGYSLISFSPVGVLGQGKRQKIWFSVAGVFCLRTTTFLRCMIQQVCRSTLGLSSYRVKS